MRLSTLLDPGRIKCGLKAADKDGALHEMVDLVSAAMPGLSADDLLTALADREKQGPFSMGKGIAFPHARTEKVSDFTVVLGTSERGIDFRAPDGRPIRIVILFVIPKKHANLYLHTLAAFLSFFQVEENVQRVVGAKSGGEAIAVIEELSPKPKEPATSRVPFRPVATVRLSTQVAQVVDRFRLSGLDGIPVVDDNGDLVGEVRASSLISVSSDRRTKGTSPLSSFPDVIISNGLSTVAEGDTPEEARRQLAEVGAAYAYVLRNRKLIGRLAARDLLQP